MASREKIDILIMRGTGRVRRYHLAAGLVRALWMTPLLLALLLVGALALIWRLNTTTNTLQRRSATPIAPVAPVVTDATMDQRLQRLAHIEQVLRSKDPAALASLLASANPDDPGWWKPQPDKPAPARPAPARPADPAPLRPNLAKLLARVDANQAGIDNLKTRFDQHNLVLHFDLSNLSPKGSLNGTGDVALITNAATLIPLKANGDDLSFQKIQRFKQIAATLPLPAQTDPKDCYALRLRVLDPANTVIFSQVFPFNRN